MIRVLVYCGLPERLTKVQQGVMAYFRHVRRSYALTGCCGCRDTLNYLRHNGEKADIFLCDFTEFEKAFPLTLCLRERNRLASWVCMGGEVKALPNCLYTRPSAYIASPEDDSQLQTVLGKLEPFHQRLHKELYFAFRCQGEQRQLPYGEIGYFESNGKKVTLHLAGSGDRYEFTAKLDDIAAQLPDCFLRCHQSYLVNMDLIRQLDTRQHLFVLNDNQEILISRRLYPQARERYQRHIQDRR